MKSMNCAFTMFVVAFLVGCGQAESDEHDHHLEHFVPAHKPPNFAEAVESLNDRTRHLEYHIGDTRPIVQTELQELSDIIGWIPELAADSDLNEADWNTARDASQSMLTLYETSGEPARLKTLLSSLQPLIESLQPLVPKAGKPEPAIHHDHDHDHDKREHDHPNDHVKGDE